MRLGCWIRLVLVVAGVIVGWAAFSGPAFAEGTSPSPSPDSSLSVPSSTVPSASDSPSASSSASPSQAGPVLAPSSMSDPSAVYTWTVGDQEWLVAAGNAVVLGVGLQALALGGLLVLAVRR